MTDLVEGVLAGDQHALARAISTIEDRSPGYRELAAALHRHAGSAAVIGITGSPGAGKSTLVDRLVAALRERGDTVGVIAIDPASPVTGGALLGDRIRLAPETTDAGVFFRSMSARGASGGLSVAAVDAVRAFDAAGMDTVVIETVGAGQNEVEVVDTADTVSVVVQPQSGDAVQMLKAGILEIGDVFVLNKADLDGAERTAQALREMIELGDDGDDTDGRPTDEDPDVHTGWTPPLVETVATSGSGIDEVLAAFDAHAAFLDAAGRRGAVARRRYAAEVRNRLHEDLDGLVETALADRGGIDDLVEAIVAGETDPYAAVEDLLEPIEDCLEGSPPGSGSEP